MKKQSIKKTCIAIGVAQALSLNTASAATITVNNGGDTGIGCTLREAVATINESSNQSNGCIIDTSNGSLGSNDSIIFGSQVRDINITSNAIEIEQDVSINLAGSRVNLTGDESNRLVDIDNGANVLIDNIKLSNGGGVSTGGGILISNTSSLTLNNSEVSDNSTSGGSGTGAGIAVRRTSTLIVNNTTISNNYAIDTGGGVSVSTNSLATINNSTITGNSGDQGGGLFVVSNSSMTVNNSTISGNDALEAEGSGGGVFIGFGGEATFNNSTISSNDAAQGGGLYVGLSSIRNVLTLNNSTVTANVDFNNPFSSRARGAGIYVRTNAIVYINNSIVAGNYSNGDFIERGIEISSISDQSIITSGINLFGNSRLTSQEAFEGITLNSNDIIATSDGNTPTALSNILAPLADNGGLTQTHALVADSPALDAASNSICAASPINNRDQRGEIRPSGAACDIGSFEIVDPTSFFVVPLPNGRSVIFGL